MIAEEVAPGHTSLRHLLSWNDDATEVDVVGISEGRAVELERLTLRHGRVTGRVAAGHLGIAARRYRYDPAGRITHTISVDQRPPGWVAHAERFAYDDATIDLTKVVWLADTTPQHLSAADHEEALDVAQEILAGGGFQTAITLWSAEPTPPLPAADPVRELRPGNRDTLAALLEAEAGLEPDVARAEAAAARWGIILEDGGDGVTRLGGRPVLPVDVPWPTVDGRALTHLATIAWAELPADVEGRDRLPADGHLALFADLTEPGGLGFLDAVVPGAEGRELLALITTSPGAAAHEPGVPDETVPRDPYDPAAMLAERRVRAVPRLQLRPDGPAADVEVDVNGADTHQLLGFPLPVQEDPRDDPAAEEILFRLAWDEPLGFSYLDGGEIVFSGAPEDLRGGHWDRVTAATASC